MLYHTARISLNRPLVGTYKQSASSTDFSKMVADAFEICDASVETIVGILRRFSAQHTLKNAPLGFVHGAVAAIDVVLATTATTASLKVDPPRSLDKNTFLSSLDAALAELSHAWTIARDARNGLQEVLRSWQSEKEATADTTNRLPPSSPDLFGPEVFDINLMDLRSEMMPSLQPRPTPVQCPPPLDLEVLGHSNFEVDVDVSTMFHYGEDSDSNFWNSLAASEDGTPSSWTGSQDSIPYLYGT